jgi:hypothetical protein
MYGLFNDAVSSPDDTAPNDRNTDEELIVKDM